MAEQEVIVRFKADIGDIEAKVKDVESTVRETEQKAKINPIDPTAEQDAKDAATAVRSLGKETQRTDNAGKSLKRQLKEMKEELQRMAAAGLQGTEAFRRLEQQAGAVQDQIGDVNARVRSLASDTPKLDALISAATGIAGAFSIAQGAVALFGVENEEVEKALLKVQGAMAVLNGLQAVADTLNKDSAISVFLNANAHTALGRAVNGSIAGIKKFFAALLANPLILLATALAAVTAGLIAMSFGSDDAAKKQKQLSEAMDRVTESSKRQEGELRNIIATIKERYDLEIRRAKATNQETSSLEQDRLKSQQDFIEQQIKNGDNAKNIQIQQIQELEEQAAKIRSDFANARDIDRIIELGRQQGQAEQTIAVLRAQVESINDLQRKGNKELQVLGVEQLELDKKLAEETATKKKESADKAKESKEKALQAELAAIDKASKEEVLIALRSNLTTEQLEAEKTRINTEAINARLVVLQKFGKDIIDEQLKLAEQEVQIANEKKQKTLEQERSLQELKLSLMKDGVEKEKIIAQNAFNDRLTELRKQGILTADLESQLSEQLNKQLIQIEVDNQRRLDDAMIDARAEGFEKERLQALNEFDKKIGDLEEQGLLTEELRIELTNEINKKIADINEAQRKEEADKQIAAIQQRADLLNKQIEVFSTSLNIVQDLIKLSGENASNAAEFQKTLAIFQVGLELAKSLASTITAATQAALATGALAPITLAGFIAQGIATVTGAFLQVKSIFDAPVPRQAAKGDEYVTGGEWGRDSVPYNLMPGERVVTTAMNDKYWDELSAIHNGNFEQFVALKYVLPALSQSSGGGFADGLMGSIGLNGKQWKGGNIVSALNNSGKQSKKQHKELIKAIQPKRTNLRKF